MISLPRVGVSLLVLLATTSLAWADEPKITIRKPEVSKDNNKFEVTPRADFQCQVVVEYPEPVTWPGIVVAHLVFDKVGATRLC